MASTIPAGHDDVWVPIESEPKYFTKLAHDLGLSPRLEFVDVNHLEAEYLANLAPAIFALLLVYPTDSDYDANRQARNAMIDRGTDLCWFKQTIYNACGYYGLLHAVCNGRARDHIREYPAVTGVLEVTWS